MKVFILAIDGLEYNLVKGWRLKDLQQRVYGWVRARTSQFKLRIQTHRHRYSLV